VRRGRVHHTGVHIDTGHCVWAMLELHKRDVCDHGVHSVAGHSVRPMPPDQLPRRTIREQRVRLQGVQGVRDGPVHQRRLRGHAGRGVQRLQDMQRRDLRQPGVRRQPRRGVQQLQGVPERDVPGPKMRQHNGHSLRDVQRMRGRPVRSGGLLGRPRHCVCGLQPVRLG
jgi:hypothetical protein